MLKKNLNIDEDSEVEIQDSDECYNPQITFIDEFEDDVLHVLAYKPE
jgi:hypothetical protein